MIGVRERPAAALAGAALLLVGVLGLLPGVTAHYGDLAFAGRGSGAKLFGVFQVSILLDLVHLALGGAGLASSRTRERAAAFLGAGGGACLVLWLLGVASAGYWIPLNTADNWLHFGFGLVLLGLGSVRGRRPTAAVL